MNSRGKKRICIICGNPFYDLNKQLIFTKCYNHRSVFKENLTPPLKEKIKIFSNKKYYPVLSPGNYIPKRFYQLASAFDIDYSKKILNGLKDKNHNDLNFFADYILKIINNDYDENLIICSVPSSRANNFDSGIHLLINQICKARKFINGFDFLIRTLDVPPKHKSPGYRTKDLDDKTIKIKSSNIFNNHKVLIIDDIVTSGNSLDVCFNKVQKDNPLSIDLFAFVVTKNEF